MERQLAQVTMQRDMLAGLLARAEQGLTVSPMPPRMAAFFDRLEAAAPDQRTRAAVRKERDVIDLVCYRGQMPPEAEYLFPDPDDAVDDAETLALYGRATEAYTDAQIEEHAAANVARFERRLGLDRARALARSIDLRAVRSVFALMTRVEPSYARIGAAMQRHLLAAIERRRNA